MKRYYRCEFIGCDDRVADFAEFLCATDRDAVAKAKYCLARHDEFVGYELWEQSRLVDARRPLVADC